MTVLSPFEVRPDVGCGPERPATSTSAWIILKNGKDEFLKSKKLITDGPLFLNLPVMRAARRASLLAKIVAEIKLALGINLPQTDNEGFDAFFLFVGGRQITLELQRNIASGVGIRAAGKAAGEIAKRLQ